MKDAAVYQRGINRSKNSERLAFLESKGMIVEKNPDVAAFRAKVKDLKNMDLYSDPRVKSLLERMLEATN